jgi:hypothetical protein
MLLRVRITVPNVSSPFVVAIKSGQTVRDVLSELQSSVALCGAKVSAACEWQVVEAQSGARFFLDSIASEVWRDDDVLAVELVPQSKPLLDGVDIALPDVAEQGGTSEAHVDTAADSGGVSTDDDDDHQDVDARLLQVIYDNVDGKVRLLKGLGSRKVLYICPDSASAFCMGRMLQTATVQAFQVYHAKQVHDFSFLSKTHRLLTIAADLVPTAEADKFAQILVLDESATLMQRFSALLELFQRDGRRIVVFQHVSQFEPLPGFTVTVAPTHLVPESRKLKVALPPAASILLENLSANVISPMIEFLKKQNYIVPGVPGTPCFEEYCMHGEKFCMFELKEPDRDCARLFRGLRITSHSIRVAFEATPGLARNSAYAHRRKLTTELQVNSPEVAKMVDGLLDQLETTLCFFESQWTHVRVAALEQLVYDLRARSPTANVLVVISSNVVSLYIMHHVPELDSSRVIFYNTSLPNDSLLSHPYCAVVRYDGFAGVTVGCQCPEFQIVGAVSRPDELLFQRLQETYGTRVGHKRSAQWAHHIDGRPGKRKKKKSNAQLTPGLQSSANVDQDTGTNSKAILHGLCVKHKLRMPTFDTVEVSGPAHARRHVVRATMDWLPPGDDVRAEAPSKKEAERKCALMILERLYKSGYMLRLEDNASGTTPEAASKTSS